MRSRSFQVCNFSRYKKETGAKLASDPHLAITPHPPGAGQEAASGRARWHLLSATRAGMKSLLPLAFLLLAWTEAAGHHHRHCFSPDDVPVGRVPTEFLRRAKRWDRHSAVQLVPYLEKERSERRRQRRHQVDECSALQPEDLQGSSIHQRSIAPWSHQIDKDENRFPSQLAFAYCLCKGCIDVKTGRENTSLNSVPVFQEMMVLRRKPCKRHAEAPGFTLEVDYVKVPVACVCVLPESSS